MFEFLNFPAVRFKKSKLTRDELERFFITREKQSKEWMDKTLNALSNNNDEEFNRLKGETIIDGSNFAIESAISRFTEDNFDNAIIERYLKNLVKNDPDYVHNFNIYNDKHLKIETSLGEIDAYKLSKIYPEFVEYFPNISDDTRYGKCHVWSKYILKNFETDNKSIRIATGFIMPFSEKHKTLHSWIEIRTNDGVYVIDATRDLYINKKGYYQCNNIEGPVYKISKKTFDREENLFNRMCSYDQNFSKFYLSNRHQAIAVYKNMLKEDQKRREEDPLYREAKHFHDSLVKAQERREREKRLNKKIQLNQKGE